MDKDNDGRFPEVPLVPSGQVARGSCLLSSIWWSFPVRSNSGYDACGSARQHLQHALGIFELRPPLCGCSGLARNSPASGFARPPRSR